MTTVTAKVVEHGTLATNSNLARSQAGLQICHNAAGASQKHFPVIEVAMVAVRGDKRPTIRLGGSWFESDYARTGCSVSIFARSAEMAAMFVLVKGQTVALSRRVAQLHARLPIRHDARRVKQVSLLLRITSLI